MTEAVPWVKFRFDKWRGDEGLRMCSLAAKGLWIELIAIMHGCDPYGHLAIKGRPPTAKQIAGLIGMTSEREVTNLLNELEDAGVFSRSPAGLIFSRRLTRDNASREMGKKFGKDGGNPTLTKRDKATGADAKQDAPRGGDNPPLYPREEKREDEIRELEKPRAARTFGGLEEHVVIDPTTGNENWTGWEAKVVKERIIDAALINDATWTGDFRPVIKWLADGIDLPSILAGIRRCSSRESYRPPKNLSYFKDAIAEEFSKLPTAERQQSIALANEHPPSRH